MNCERFVELLADALGNELPSTTQTDFDTHLASCAKCRREYQSMQDTVSTLRQLPPAPQVAIERLNDTLVLGRPMDLRRSITQRLSGLLRYAAVILLAFSAGFASRSGSAIAPTDRPGAGDGSRWMQPAEGDADGTVRMALVTAHRQRPGSTKLTKLLVALHSPTQH